MYRIIFALVFLASVAGCSDKPLFEKIDDNKSGIQFSNMILENDSMNVLDIENIYNGGGIGVADFDNDGLQDLYFSGNNVPNKLYLNKGDFSFKDITTTAGVEGAGKWCRGISIVDINNDGWQDIYVCATILSDTVKRENILYINRGLNANGEPVFQDMANEYGLNDPSHSTMAAFFDYDNDGDLDMYLLINEINKKEFPNKFRPIYTNREHPSSDKLYQNNWSDSLKHPVFTDVSAKAGITIEGFGHGVTICDINRDGWKDIYVTNDFLPNNILYINNKNGSFTDQVKSYLKHSSANAMGQDVIDVNNDGLADIIELDMNPEDNFRKKMMLNPIAYQNFQLSDFFGYQYQYVRNTLQINQGPTVLENDTIGHPVFSDLSYLAGIDETDWSWTPSVADFDNDGNRDIIITNGFPKDVTDHDFMAFRQKAMMLTSKAELLGQIPKVKIANYAFRNNGNLGFENVTKIWGFDAPSFSNGAVWVDLDNDGDLDYVVNNIDDKAFLYKNNSKPKTNNFLQVVLKGDSNNKNGLGAIVSIKYDQNKTQVYECSPYRGYLSTVQHIAHFGLGKISTVDTLVIEWPNGNTQIITGIASNQVLKVDIKNAKTAGTAVQPLLAHQTLFKEITSSVNISWKHLDSPFIDFNIQRLLPHKFSEYGPALAAGDINADGYDDFVTGRSFHYSTQFFLQRPDGKFVQKQILPDEIAADRNKSEDMGILLFDADNDNDLDYLAVSGGYEDKPFSNAYRDRFYINDGAGNFRVDSIALPVNLVSKSCVRAADYDNDGDLDLLISGRVEPGNYPKPVSSFLYRNDSKDGIVKFTDITQQFAKGLQQVGLICDALFTDFNSDGWMDIILVGEWQPIRFFVNENGSFRDISEGSGVFQKTGWWNSIVPGDFDNDGDIDYVVGNLGKNSFYKANEQFPVSITASDFDKNGSYDALLSVYLPESAEKNQRTEFSAHLRDDFIAQLAPTRRNFPDYKSYATATHDQLIAPFDSKDLIKMKATELASSILLNEGMGSFSLKPLPIKAQVSLLNGMVVEDFDSDGFLDIVINGNDYGTEVSIGRYDALNGLYLKGKGNGEFTPLTILESGIYIPGNGKALSMLISATGNCLLAASQNNGALKVLSLKSQDTCFRFLPNDVTVKISFKNGSTQKRELNYGSSFLSQSSRMMIINQNISSLEIVNSKLQKRVVKF